MHYSHKGQRKFSSCKVWFSLQIIQSNSEKSDFAIYNLAVSQSILLRTWRCPYHRPMSSRKLKYEALGLLGKGIFTSLFWSLIAVLWCALYISCSCCLRFKLIRSFTCLLYLHVQYLSEAFQGFYRFWYHSSILNLKLPRACTRESIGSGRWKHIIWCVTHYQMCVSSVK